LKPLSNAKPKNLQLITFSIPATPRTAHKARSIAREALELVTRNLDTSSKLRALIGQLNNYLQQSITEKEIGNIIHKKFRDQVTQRSNAATNNRRRLTKARVITTEEVIRLREQRDATDAKKAAKASKGKGKEKKIKSAEFTTPKPRGRPKNVVSISDEVIVHSISSEKEVGVVPNKEG
jgi:murein endopeptidase